MLYLPAIRRSLLRFAATALIALVGACASQILNPPLALADGQSNAAASSPAAAPAPETPKGEPLAPIAPGWNQLPDGLWYYGNPDGSRLNGWLFHNGSWYLLREDAKGAMATGWANANGTWYLLDGSGAMLTGWQQVGSTWYHLYDSGAMATGWIWVGNAWYYLNEDGAMATGWLQLGNDWYYLYDDGAMATESCSIGTAVHYFNESGVWTGSYDVGAQFTEWAQPEWSATDWLILVDTNQCKVAVFHGSQWNWSLQHLWDCAPGRAGTPTVKGRFSTGSKGYYFDNNGIRCFYYTQFRGNYLFHSVLYRQLPTPSQVADGRVGIPLSHGCVRLQLGNAKWIYDNIPYNTRVYVW